MFGCLHCTRCALFYIFLRKGREEPKSGVAPANQTKERSVHELFAGAFRNKSSIGILLVFLRKNTRIHKKRAKFMNFSFWPSLWFAGATPGKGQFSKRAGLANVPSFRFWSPGISKSIAFFCLGSTAGKDFLEEANIRRNHPFGNQPFAKPLNYLWPRPCFPPTLYPQICLKLTKKT